MCFPSQKIVENQRRKHITILLLRVREDAKIFAQQRSITENRERVIKNSEPMNYLPARALYWSMEICAYYRLNTFLPSPNDKSRMTDQKRAFVEQEVSAIYEYFELLPPDIYLSHGGILPV